MFRIFYGVNMRKVGMIGFVRGGFGCNAMEPFVIFTFFQKRPFVHNSVCSQFLEGLFAILAECSQFCLRSF